MNRPMKIMDSMIHSINSFSTEKNKIWKYFWKKAVNTTELMTENATSEPCAVSIAFFGQLLMQRIQLSQRKVQNGRLSTFMIAFTGQFLIQASQLSQSADAKYVLANINLPKK